VCSPILNASRIVIVDISGTEDTAPAPAFTLASFTDITRFNPVQTAALPWATQDVNMLLASVTNTGKTKVAEMVIAAALAEDRPAIYAAPLKALSREKYEAWTNPEHPFSGKKISVVTGDYRLTAARQKELASADIIIMTSEMLDSRCRNVFSEGSDFLRRVGVVVADELHLLGMEGRGDKLESGLVRFSVLNREAKIVALSATLPNMEELAEWVASLNGKRTVLIRSKWRAVPLIEHFEPYKRTRFTAETRENLRKAVLATLKSYPNDKALVFVHDKATGRVMLKGLERLGIRAEFHCADLDRDEREEIEQNFRDSGNGLRVVVATSTLAWGVNFPARRVVIAGVHRGKEEVTAIELLQMAGRAGRMGLDARGDVHYLVPLNRVKKWQHRIENPGDVSSQMRSPRILKFHIISEIANGFANTVPELHRWYLRTLAHAQVRETEAAAQERIMDAVVMLLQDGAVKLADDGTLTATELGVCANGFYLDPSLLADLVRNFGRVFQSENPDDPTIAWGLSATRAYDEGWVGNAARVYVDAFMDQLGCYSMSYAQGRYGACHWAMLQGSREVGPLISIYQQLHMDTDRIVSALAYLDGRYANWDKAAFWKSLGVRLRYGVPEDLVSLCGIRGVGRAFALKLWDAGIKNEGDFYTNPEAAKEVLGSNVYVRIVSPESSQPDSVLDRIRQQMDRVAAREERSQKKEIVVEQMRRNLYSRRA
jgi:helicase